MFIVISLGRAPICNDTERKEMPVRAEEQVYVYSSHIMENELVDNKIYELRTLEADEPFNLWAALDSSLIVN